MGRGSTPPIVPRVTLMAQGRGGRERHWAPRAQSSGSWQNARHRHPLTNELLGARAAMATDYDAPRKTDEELAEDSLEELKARRVDKAASTVDVDEAELAETLELPGADLSDESLTVRVLPRQADEFTCSSCFLVHHRSQLDHEGKNGPVCTDCA